MRVLLFANDPKQTFLHSRERGRPITQDLPRSSTTSVHLNAPNPIAQVIARDRVGRTLQGQLFRNPHKQGARQFAVRTHERCVVGLVVLTKNGRWPGVGVFFGQGFVGRALMVKFCTDRRLSICSSRLFRFGQNPYRHKKGYWRRVCFAPMKRC